MGDSIGGGLRFPDAEHAKAPPARQLDRFLELLEVKLDAFAVCEIANGCALRCDPLDFVVVHFVLEGRGSLSWSDGVLAIEPGSMIVIPKHLPKQISASGPVVSVIDASDACPMVDGIVRFRAASGEADMVIGCAALQARIGDEFDLLDNLTAPLREQADDGLLPLLFKTMLAELSSEAVGTRAIVSAIMKQIVLLFLRNHFHCLETARQTHSLIPDDRLTRAVGAMSDNLEAPHALEDLARTAGMSRSRFSECFAAAYGTSPMQFLQSARLTRAARMLETSSLPTKAIASAVGYTSRSHFSRAFQRKFGIRPSHYRKTGHASR